jgi:hypothetical protein
MTSLFRLRPITPLEVTFFEELCAPFHHYAATSGASSDEILQAAARLQIEAQRFGYYQTPVGVSVLEPHEPNPSAMTSRQVNAAHADICRVIDILQTAR